MASSLGAAAPLLILLTFAAIACQAFGPGLRIPWRLQAADNELISSDTLYFENQKLDHFSSEDSRVFKQRYFENLESFEHHDGPIFLKLCGESTCYDFSTTSFIANVSRAFGGAVVSLEHRYYGSSIPFQNLTAKNMEYLSSKQALFDAAVFLNYYQELINKRYNKQGFNRWLVIGGSYSGALSAWFRLKFPHLVVGSWASSAVVQAVLNYTDYDKQVGISVGPECKSALQEVTRLVEKGLAENATAIKAKFKSEQLNDVDFLRYVADTAAGLVQYGFSDELCRPLLLAGTNASKVLEAYSNLTLTFIGSSELYDADKLKAAAEANDENARNSFSWSWQYCTEFGFFQVAPQNDSIRSSRVNSQYMLDYCSKLFGKGTHPDVVTTNLYYGGWNISGSRIMFLNGSQDPWRHASKQVSSAEEPAFVLNCQTCAHAADLSAFCSEESKCKELEKAHTFIIQNVNSWLFS